MPSPPVGFGAPTPVAPPAYAPSAAPQTYQAAAPTQAYAPTTYAPTQPTTVGATGLNQNGPIVQSGVAGAIGLGAKVIPAGTSAARSPRTRTARW